MIRMLIEISEEDREGTPTVTVSAKEESDKATGLESFHRSMIRGAIMRVHEVMGQDGMFDMQSEVRRAEEKP